jgi:hypothetical protein
MPPRIIASSVAVMLTSAVSAVGKAKRREHVLLGDRFCDPLFYRLDPIEHCANRGPGSNLYSL